MQSRSEGLCTTTSGCTKTGVAGQEPLQRRGLWIAVYACSAQRRTRNHPNVKYSPFSIGYASSSIPET